jgi:hypothetical protein
MPAQQHSDPFEDRVAAELRDTGGRFDADPHALTTAGLTRGRRLRMRRRAAVVGGAASLALVGVGGTLLLPGNGTDPDRASVGSTSSASPSPTASASPGVPAVSAQELIGTLKEQLGYGKFSQETGRGTADAPYAWLVWDDGDGGSAVSVSLGRVEPGSTSAREVTECPDKTFTPYDSCKTSRLDDGSVLRIFQGYEYPDKREPTKHWTAELVTPRGEHVSVYEWNAEAEKGSPVTREEPPLDAAELKKIATAPAWLKAIEAIPETPAASPAPEDTALPTTDIRKTLVDLLPDGMTPVSVGGDESGWGYVVADDGKGRSLVEINVQPNMGDLLGESVFEGAKSVGDEGTMVVTRVDSGDKGVSGAVRWTVDTVRINGLRVVISALNAGGPHEAPSRAEPALTMEQLQKIALSSKWGPSREELYGQKNSDQG